MTCSFCGKGGKDRRVLIVAPEGAICDFCAQEASMVLDSYDAPPEPPPPEAPTAKVISFADAIARRAKIA